MLRSMALRQKRPNWRCCCRNAGWAGAAGPTLAVMSRQPAASPDAAAVKDLPKPEKGGGYALTEHVKRYYQTTRI